MDNDEVIPPSPQVKLKKPRLRRKNATTPRQKKRKRPTGSLRENEMMANNTVGSMNVASFSETNKENSISPEFQVNIYAGLDDISSEEKSYTVSVLKNFDVLSQSKLIEKCNQLDLAQSQRVTAIPRIPQTNGLISLKELLATQSSNESEDSVIAHDISCSQNTMQKEANLSSLADYAFSEWPVDCKGLAPNPATATSEPKDDSITPQNSGHRIMVLNSNLSSCSTNSLSPKSMVQNILNDFDDGDDQLDSGNITSSPPFVLVRKKNRKTYERNEVAAQKYLVSTNEDEDNEIAATQMAPDIDIDLNSSRRILENLTQLNTFFTQPQTYELDFNADLTHTIDVPNGEFTSFSQHSDDFLCLFEPDELNVTAPKTELFVEPIEVDASTNARQKNDYIHELSDMEDDLFAGIDTPKAEPKLRCTNAVRFSTPLIETHRNMSTMHSTPSTSKPAIMSDQLVPKRLRFDRDIEQKVENTSSTNASGPTFSKCAGFATARGGTIQMSEATLKRAKVGIFANIDDDFDGIDPIAIETPNAKKAKRDNGIEIEMDQQASEQKESRKCVGFQLASGAKSTLPKSNVQKARNIFQEDLSDLGMHQPGPSFRAFESVSSGINFGKGFATAGGASIKVSADNLQKFAQTLKDVGKSVCDEYKVTDEPNENVLACKTPMGKLQLHSKLLTSTPNPSSINAFKNCPPVTPINLDTSDDEFSSWIEALDGPEKDHLTINTQSRLHSKSTSAVLNDSTASDFHPLNDSVADNGANLLNIGEEIKCQRQNALSQQQADCFKKSHPIRPHIGWLSVQKLLNSMQLHDLGKPTKFQRDVLARFGVQPNVVDLNVDNALKFKFDMWQFYPMELCQTNIDGIDMKDEMKLIMDGNSRAGLREITSSFLQCASVDPKLVPDHWIENSFKWILVKLAGYERSFPQQFAGTCLTPENVLAQLKFRYDREIDKVQRSAIRKIVEQDDSAAKRMVLFVSRIIVKNLVYTMDLCDGWYSIPTGSLDAVLTNAISKGKITIGTKLVIQGAELVGIEEACTPLEMPISVALKISGNSTRRARWHAKLGYCNESWPFSISLNSVNGNGGLITRMKAYVLRVYPLVYIVKQTGEGGSKTVYRSNKMEQRQGKKDDKKRFEMYEKCYSEAHEEVEKEYQAQKKKYKKRKLCDIDDGEELWNFMENSNDGVSFEMDLTETQRRLLNNYQTKYTETKESEIAALVKEKMGAIENPSTSTPLQKVRLIDASSPVGAKTAILSIWNDSYSSLRENTFLDLQNVTANGMRGRDIQLTAGSRSQLREIQSTPLDEHEQFARKLTPLAEIDMQLFKPLFNEFDTLGFVFQIDEPFPNHSQSVFIVDAMKNILCIKFWGSINHYAYDDIVRVNKFLVINHLDWRSQNRIYRDGIAQAFVTEITTFSENPKSDERATALRNLRTEFESLNQDEYVEFCCQKLQDAQANKENSSVNISSKASDSSLSKPFDASLNQSMLSRPSPGPSNVGKPIGVVERIDRLKNYGSPGVFRSSYLNNTRTPDSIRKPFKNALTKK